MVLDQQPSISLFSGQADSLSALLLYIQNHEASRIQPILFLGGGVREDMTKEASEVCQKAALKFPQIFPLKVINIRDIFRQLAIEPLEKTTLQTGMLTICCGCLAALIGGGTIYALQTKSPMIIAGFRSLPNKPEWWYASLEPLLKLPERFGIKLNTPLLFDKRSPEEILDKQGIRWLSQGCGCIFSGSNKIGPVNIPTRLFADYCKGLTERTYKLIIDNEGPAII